ncbi:MAG: hypothetical protein ACR2PR_03070 [Pseudohongiellaceae bacterium]
MSKDQFQVLSDKVDALIESRTEVRQENQALRVSEGSRQDECRELQKKTQDARSRLESILRRLKTLNSA